MSISNTPLARITSLATALTLGILLQACGDLDNSDVSDAADDQSAALSSADLVITKQFPWSGGSYNNLTTPTFTVSADMDLWIGFRCTVASGNPPWAFSRLVGRTDQFQPVHPCDGKLYRDKVSNVKAGSYYMTWASPGVANSVTLVAWRLR